MTTTSHNNKQADQPRPQTKKNGTSMSKKEPNRRQNIRKLRSRRDPKKPVLRFSPRAWLKLQYLCHAATTEVGGFGISRHDDLLYIEDVLTVPQQCTLASIEFDDQGVADFFDDQVEAGRKPGQFARIWIHTHPGDSAQPSGLDEETFDRVFGHCHWAVMCILARGGEIYCRLRVNSGPSSNGDRTNGSVMLAETIPVHVDYEMLVEDGMPIDQEAWLEELKAHVKVVDRFPASNLLDLDAFEIEASVLDQLDDSIGSEHALFDPFDADEDQGEGEVDDAD